MDSSLLNLLNTVCRMDEYALIGTSSESISKSVSLDGARRMALKNIESFVLKFSDQQSFSAAAASSAPAALAQVTEGARIQEAGHLRCRFARTLSLFPLPPIRTSNSLSKFSSKYQSAN